MGYNSEFGGCTGTFLVVIIVLAMLATGPAGWLMLVFLGIFGVCSWIDENVF